MSGRKVVVTGLGVVSPVASELKKFWENIQNGVSGIDTVKGMGDEIEKYPVHIGGEIRDLDTEKFVDRKELRKMDPFAVWGVAASMMAVEDAGLNPEELDCERVGASPVQESAACSSYRMSASKPTKKARAVFPRSSSLR